MLSIGLPFVARMLSSELSIHIWIICLQHGLVHGCAGRLAVFGLRRATISKVGYDEDHVGGEAVGLQTPYIYKNSRWNLVG